MVKKKLSRSRTPKEVFPDSIEDERKYRILGKTFKSREKKLEKIFNFVVKEKKHFVFLDMPPHTNSFDRELVAASRPPRKDKHLRQRYYWGTNDLDGYKPGDKGKAEVRTEREIGRSSWEQTVKLGGNSGRTLKRPEHKRFLDKFGTNLNVYPEDVRKPIRAVIGKKRLKPLINVQSQSRVMYYHPEGRKDVLFEIKFDLGKGWTFDGCKETIIEVEIEVAEAGPRVTEAQIEKLFDKAEKILLGRFSDHIEPIYESKVANLFRHLVGWRARDEAGFREAFQAQPTHKWAEYKPS